MKVFANTEMPLFYTRDGEVVAALSLPQEYVPHRLIYYRKNDYLGRATGKVQTDTEGKVLRREVEINYLHWWTWGEGMPSKALQCSVHLWVDASDTALENEVSFRHRNALACRMTMLRVAGRGLWKPAVSRPYQQRKRKDL